MTWSPTRRYSAVAVFSQDLERVVLIHKLRPAWQAGKANFPGGKVENQDWEFDWIPRPCDLTPEKITSCHRRCAARELQEETGLVVDASSLTLFCTLRFRSHEGDDAECQFFCCRSDVYAAQTRESERIFVHDTDVVTSGSDVYHETYRSCGDLGDFISSHTQTKECTIMGADVAVPTMSNLPWLTAMARQTLRGDSTDSTPPFVVYEAGAKEHA